ncbi:hypothetical protein D3C78_1194210 [compost metagenome]
MREDADGKIEREGIILSQPLYRLEAAQTRPRIDLHMGAHMHRTFGNRHLYRPRPAGIDVLDRIVPLQMGNRGNRPLQPTSGIAATAEQTGLVEMHMGIDEARQHQPPADRLILVARAGGDPANGGDAAIHNTYILQHGTPPQAHIA